MSVRITYFVHGTTTDNEQRNSSGWKDTDLSNLCFRQAAGLREQTRDRIFEAVFCSDLKRAHRSAMLVWKGLCPIMSDSRLRECNFGRLNGAPSHLVESKAKQGARISRPFPDGESYEDVKDRVAGFLASLKGTYDGKHVAIMAHKAPQLALDVLLAGKSWQQAFAEDWRRTGAWRPGWEYVLT